ncbi:hypothetical protein BFP76_03885 [Amylibacter kogurei]|uniref:HTH araC/xylS-type domain-containing protein n=1 Tax=Paramylibacter kogurei TaxID=1889778 RepID=A0A2G5K6M9_9RHOB|nr:AraC family transcriptional regulator [Amylibacter kogurei]PIB24364.1 hypothetical protein BFP76_03885 [Amylibacter kogurei]
MTNTEPASYCFFQSLEPRPATRACFDRDYLIYAKTGALRVTINGESWLLAPSFAAWVPANTPMLVEISKPVTACSILARPGFCTLMPNTPIAFQMSPMTRHMVQHCKEWGKDNDHPPEAENFFQALLNACAALANSAIDIKRPFSHDPVLQKAIDFSDAHLSKKITAQDVARATNQSERTIQRRFSQNLGITWSQLVTQLRMIHGVQLLAEGDLSIIQISGECGYQSLSAFNRAFLKFANCTPSEFRKTLE